MSDNQKYQQYVKRAWMIYSVLAVVIATVLVLFVANDMEEQFFYGLMTLGAAYVFRPTEKGMARLVKKYTGVSPANGES